MLEMLSTLRSQLHWHRVQALAKHRAIHHRIRARFSPTNLANPTRLLARSQLDAVILIAGVSDLRVEAWRTSLTTEAQFLEAFREHFKSEGRCVSEISRHARVDPRILRDFLRKRCLVRWDVAYRLCTTVDSSADDRLRFVHAPGYAATLCSAHGLDVKHLDRTIIRRRDRTRDATETPPSSPRSGPAVPQTNPAAVQTDPAAVQTDPAGFRPILLVSDQSCRSSNLS